MHEVRTAPIKPLTQRSLIVDIIKNLILLFKISDITTEGSTVILCNTKKYEKVNLQQKIDNECCTWYVAPSSKT